MYPQGKALPSSREEVRPKLLLQICQDQVILVTQHCKRRAIVYNCVHSATVANAWVHQSYRCNRHVHLQLYQTFQADVAEATE